MLRPGGSIAPQAALLLACSKRNERLRIVNPIIGILPHAVDRRTVLERHPEWRDGTDEGIEVLQQVLDDIESPADRVSRLTEWQARSAATFYASVNDDTQQDGGLNLKTFLVPSVHSLVRYFRLNEAEVNDSLSFTDLWENSTQRMVDDFGIEETLIRAACLPVPLPRRLLERIAERGRRTAEIFERLLPLMTSPVSALHVIDLGLMLSTKAAEVANCRAVCPYLHEDRHTVDFENMQCILRLTQRCLARRRDFGQLPAALRLALIWGHALAVRHSAPRSTTG